MNKHSTYGLFYIALFPVAFLIGITVLLCLIPAFANPVILIFLFLFAGFVVYTISSFIFYNRAVRQQLEYKSSLRDLIRINAFIIILPSLFFILQGLSVAANPGIINTIIQQIKTMQQQMPSMTDSALAKFLVRLYYFLMGYAIIVLIHIFYTFWLLKQFKPAIEN